MRDVRHLAARAAMTMTLAMLGVLTLSSDALAAYRAWFAYTDDVGVFEAGDVSEDTTKLLPPSWACGFRIDMPNYYRWAGEDGNTIDTGHFSKDVIIWIENPHPAANCSRPFSVKYKDGTGTFAPPLGTHYLEISTNYGTNWVNDDGIVPGCDCAAPVEFMLPTDNDWAWPAVSTFAAISAGFVDPHRQPSVVGQIRALAGQVKPLRPFLEKQVALRRRTPLGSREASVRALEEAALKQMATALTSIGQCETLARQGRHAEAFVACETSSRALEGSQSLLKTSRFLSLRPSR